MRAADYAQLLRLLDDIKRARKHIDEALVICNTGGLSSWELRQVIGFCLAEAKAALGSGHLCPDCRRDLREIGEVLDAMREGAASAGVLLSPPQSGRTLLGPENVDGEL